MAARSMWTGSISFGLVNIPVKMYTAVREQRVAFHMLHDQDKSRLQRKMVSTSSGKEVHSEHTIRGFEVAPGQMVVFTESELESIAPKTSRHIEIRDFVDQGEIDPVYYDRPYYLAPDENAAKSYQLLMHAMLTAKKIGMAKFVMRNKEYLAALRPLDGALCLDTMHFADEVIPVEDIPGLPLHGKPEEREMKMAMQLINALTTEFNPEHYKDEYRERVLEMAQKKAAGEEIITQPEPKEKPGRVSNLLEALEASLAQSKDTHKGETRRQQTRRRKSA
jgi:DNA end-binding protein Ku